MMGRAVKRMSRTWASVPGRAVPPRAGSGRPGPAVPPQAARGLDQPAQSQEAQSQQAQSQEAQSRQAQSQVQSPALVPALGGGADVPRWLRAAAAWSWRLLLLAVVLYVAGRVASLLYVVIVPSAAAILLTALLQPLTARLRRAGLGPLAATWCTLLLAFVLLGGAVWLVTSRVEAEYPALVTQVKHTTTQIQSWLAGAPFHIKTGNLDRVFTNLVNYLSTHRSAVEGVALTGTRIVVEILAGIVLCFFISFFLIKDGEKIWGWLVGGMAPERRRRANLGGHAAWQAVVYYVRGTVAVAAIHALVMGITLAIIGAPLVAPLALLMFIAAFIPLVGVLIAGTVAILIVLASKGLVAAVVVLAVMIVMNQLEGHLLQPQVVGKMVRLHPLAVILVLAVSVVVAGVAGAVVAVPVTAAITSAARALHSDDHKASTLVKLIRFVPGAVPRSPAAGGVALRGGHISHSCGLCIPTGGYATGFVAVRPCGSYTKSSPAPAAWSALAYRSARCGSLA